MARAGRAHGGAPDAGQATVELALALPVVALLLLVVVQVTLVVRDQVLVVHAARAAARAAALRDGSRAAADGTAAARAAAPHLDPGRLRVTVRRTGANVEAVVRYRSPTDLPLVGALVGDVEVVSGVVMPVEP